VTDVVRQSSLLLVAGDAAFIRCVDYPEQQPGVFELREVVSRKKQLLPYLTELLDQMRADLG
jgi:manganese-dependent inorganic pyrophosphatase